MNEITDKLIIIIYFVVILIAGWLVSRRNKNVSADEIITGGHQLNWWRAALNVIAVSFDAGTFISAVGWGFIWGMNVQWNAVNLWFTAPFAALFILPIYWRSKISSIPELFEKRFSKSIRLLFSSVLIILILINISVMTIIGSIVFNKFYGWPQHITAFGIIIFIAFYAIKGGVKTVLSINTYQSVFLLIIFFIIAAISLYHVGGIEGMVDARLLTKAGTPMASLMPPAGWHLYDNVWFPLPSVFLWAPWLSIFWLPCNAVMIQRLMASKNVRHSQKALIAIGGWNALFCLVCYIIGVCIAILFANSPEVKPENALLTFITNANYFPVGLKGLVIAALIASLIMALEGNISAGSNLLLKDIYPLFDKRPLNERQEIRVNRLIQLFLLLLIMGCLTQLFNNSRIVEVGQIVLGDISGVLAALLLVGIFSKRATNKAAIISSLTGFVIALALHYFTKLNFPYFGSISFFSTIFLIIGLSYFEKPMPIENLKNITVHTMEGLNGPFIGFHFWPGLLKWMIVLTLGWWTLSFLWQWYIANI